MLNIKNWLYTVLLLAILQVTSAYSQKSNNTDSLLKVIAAEKVDTIKARKLNQLAREFRRNNPELAIKYATEALGILQKSSIAKGTSTSYFLIGTAQMNLSNYAEAYSNFNIAITIGKDYNEHKVVAASYNNIGIIYIKQGKSNEALEYYLKGLEIRQKENLKEDVPASYANIGNVYYQQKNYGQALKYYTMALNLFEKTNYFGLANSNHNIGDVYAMSGKYDSAIYFYKTSIELNKLIGDKRGIASGYKSIAETFLERNMPNEAEEYFKTALELYVETSDMSSITEVNFDLARAEFLRGQLDASLKRTGYVLDLYKKSKDNQGLRNCYLLLTQIYEKKGAHKEALINHKLHLAHKDSVLNEETTKRFIEQQLNHEFGEKEEQLKQEQLKKDIYAQEQLKNQKLVTRAALIVGCLILVLLALSLYAYKDKQKSHKIIESQKALVEEKQTSIIDSITYAKRLQQAILPKLEVVSSSFPNNFILYLPKDIVAGDFYWTTESNDHYYIAICDCTGHGVPGAFMSLLNIGFLSEAIKERNIVEPNKIFDYVRTRLIEGIGNEGQQDGMDGILMCFNKKNNVVTYAAANNAPVLIREKTLKILELDKMPVGKGIKMAPFTLFHLELKKDDSLYLFTDGFADQFGGPLGKKYKNKQLEELLLSVETLNIMEQQPILAQTFNNWKGQLEQVDDVLIMGIKI